MKIFILTGFSGSGKSAALAALEDIGYYCVDNMPVALLPKFLELPFEKDAALPGFAFVMDLREKQFLSSHADVFSTMKAKGYQIEILFFEAREDVLVRRYSQTRRHHPMSQDGGGIADGIRFEAARLAQLRENADQVLDTSGYTVHELKRVVHSLVTESRKRVPMRIRVFSFGFKFGAPHDADLVVDVRFLNNPFFIPELREKTGETPEVDAFVMGREETGIFLEKYLDLLDFLVPRYEKEGKAYLSIGVGCTGGHHRSVVIARRIYSHLNTEGRWVHLSHRDIEKE